MDDIESLFAAGVDDYWSGDVPENWDNPKARETSPYLTGWYMASMWDNEPGWITYANGLSVQPED